MNRHTRALPLMLLGVFLASNAFAGPKEDVAAAAVKWTEIFAQNNPDTISALYAKDGVLWGTLSPTVRSDPAPSRLTSWLRSMRCPRPP
jgi:hypothetical protein